MLLQAKPLRSTFSSSGSPGYLGLTVLAVTPKVSTQSTDRQMAIMHARCASVRSPVLPGSAGFPMRLPCELRRKQFRRQHAPAGSPARHPAQRQFHGRRRILFRPEQRRRQRRQDRGLQRPLPSDPFDIDSTRTLYWTPAPVSASFPRRWRLQACCCSPACAGAIARRASCASDPARTRCPAPPPFDTSAARRPGRGPRWRRSRIRWPA